MAVSATAPCFASPWTASRSWPALAAIAGSATPPTPGGRRFYSTEQFTPDQIRQRRIAALAAGSDLPRRTMARCPLQRGHLGLLAQRRRQAALASVGRGAHSLCSGKGKRKYYREPAFLLTTDLHRSAAVLLQAYFDRWQIEVNHREIKDTLGIGQAQLRNPRSVPRQPAMLVAAYSALLLAGILVFGDARPEAAFPALPKWRRHARRPSCLDLVTLLRQEVASSTGSSSLPCRIDWKNLVLAANA